MKIDQVVVPGGCTKFVQPADVSWNKPFKDRYREKYQEWMLNNEQEYTESGNMKAPPLTNVLTWIESSWKEISKESIVKSFLSCGISNYLDGSQDHLIHCLEGDEMKSGREMLQKECNFENFQDEEDEEQLNQLETNYSDDSDFEIL